MSLSRLSFFIFSFGVSVPAYTLPQIRLITSYPEILEVVGSYPPGPVGSESTRPTVVIPYQKTFTQFGGLTPDNSFTLENQKVVKQQDSSNKLNLNPTKIEILPRPVCGNSPEQNTMICFDLNRNGQYIASYPVPGSLSTTPIFADNSWLIGTAKGFLVRVDANKENKYLPTLGNTNTALWGTYSRKYMASFRPKPIYTEQGKPTTPVVPNTNENKETTTLSPGIKWVFPSSSEFVGTPIIHNGFVYIFSASQYLQALDWNTGKLAWALRLAPDVNLRLASNALVVTPSEVIVGSDLGMLLILNPKNGSILWSWKIPGATPTQREQTQLPAGPDRFESIVAQPLLNERNLIVSNAESMTQNISLDSKTAVWSYPIGSVAQAKRFKESIFIGSSTGKIISLNYQSGDLLWSTKITDDSSPIMSLFITKSEVILAATSRGQIFMIDPISGKVLAKNLPIGETNGEFFAGYDNADACISFSQNGFRCFYAKVK
jgi:outer membrane protein assembly factor BamB